MNSPNCEIPQAENDLPVWLEVDRLFDGMRETPHGRSQILYNRKEFLFVGEDLPPPELRGAARKCAFPGHSLLPGLIEGHSHVHLRGGELDAAKRKAYQELPPDELLRLARERMLSLARKGIVASRDGGDKDGVGLALARERREGQGTGFRTEVFSPGAGIHRAKRYGSFFSRPHEEYESSEACVQGRIDAGADHVKLVPTGIINFEKGEVTAPPQYSDEEVSAFTRAAHARGFQVMAHASGAPGIGNAVEGGVDTVEHAYFVTRDQLARMRDLNTVWVPTLAPVRRQLIHADVMGWSPQVVAHLRRILDDHAASLQTAIALGVRVRVGSDAGSCGVPHGEGLLDEMEWMQEAGLSAAALIRAVTGGNAEMLPTGTRIGRIAAGFRPHLLLIPGDPSRDLRLLRQPAAVIADGQRLEGASRRSG